MIRVLRPVTFHGRQLVDPAGTYGRGRLGTEDKALRKTPVCFQISERAVVDARDIDHGGKSVVQDAVHLVHAACHRPRRIFPVADVLQKLRYLIPVRAALRRDFITYTPHHDARVVPVLTEHIDHIFLRPGAEMPMIAV